MSSRPPRRRRWRALALVGLVVACSASVPLTGGPSAGGRRRPVLSRSRPGGTVVLRGHGFGHGHGMSQYGAQGAAKQGLTYRQIIDFYYPGTSWSDGRGQGAGADQRGHHLRRRRRAPCPGCGARHRQPARPTRCPRPPARRAGGSRSARAQDASSTTSPARGTAGSPAGADARRRRPVRRRRPADARARRPAAGPTAARCARRPRAPGSARPRHRQRADDGRLRARA